MFIEKETKEISLEDFEIFLINHLDISKYVSNVISNVSDLISNEFKNPCGEMMLKIDQPWESQHF